MTSELAEQGRERERRERERDERRRRDENSSMREHRDQCGLLGLDALSICILLICRVRLCAFDFSNLYVCRGKT
jgi:hypothetical protein